MNTDMVLVQIKHAMCCGKRKYTADHKYQGIVYAVCCELDKQLGRSITKGTGLLAEEGELVTAIRRLGTELSQARQSRDWWKSCHDEAHSLRDSGGL